MIHYTQLKDIHFIQLNKFIHQKKKKKNYHEKKYIYRVELNKVKSMQLLMKKKEKTLYF